MLFEVASCTYRAFDTIAILCHIAAARADTAAYGVAAVVQPLLLRQAHTLAGLKQPTLLRQTHTLVVRQARKCRGTHAHAAVADRDLVWLGLHRPAAV